MVSKCAALLINIILLVPSQTNISTTKSPGLKPLVFAPLAPIKGSTTSSVNVTPAVKAMGKENIMTSSPSKKQLMRVASSSRTRKPAGPRRASATPDSRRGAKANNGRNADVENENPAKSKEKQGKRGRALQDLSINSSVNSPLGPEKNGDTSTVSSNIGKGSVKERWLDWERERERLREMDRMEENIKEAEEEKARKQDEQEVEITFESGKEDDHEDEVEGDRETAEINEATSSHQPDSDSATSAVHGKQPVLDFEISANPAEFGSS
jgi:serine/threonine-protein kinase GIN4